MPSRPVATDATTTNWEIATALRARATAMALRADPNLQPVPDAAGGLWRSSGERGCFTLSGRDLGGALPAGWYWLEGRLELEQGIAAAPCLYPGYARGADGDAQIPLPEPDDDDRIRALVLFKYDVASLRFCPVQAPSRFRLSGFNLSRVSRTRALGRMLASTPLALGGAMRRAAGFVLAALRAGVSPATDALYRDYRRRLLPEEGDYAGWIARHDTLTAERMEHLHVRAARLGDAGPLISILLPVYQTPERWLRRCIESVLAQAYPRWELCIADD